jgi:hypothetical protein
MPLDPTKVAIRASSQEHLEIEDIRDSLVILKDGGSALVLATTAINFGLLSEKEQDATIYAYAALLNSLTYSIQLIIRSKKKDVSGYLKLLDQAEVKAKEEKIKIQIRKYRGFIQEIVTKNEVLDKKFYLVIPMLATELGVAKTLSAGLSRKKKLPFPKDYILDKAKANLYPKRDHLIKQLGRIGLKARQLNTQELIQLYFEIYNPDTTSQTVGLATDYQTPLVQAGQKPAAEMKAELPVGPPEPVIATSAMLPPNLKSAAKPPEPMGNDSAKPENLQDQASQLVEKATQP